MPSATLTMVVTFSDLATPDSVNAATAGSYGLRSIPLSISVKASIHIRWRGYYTRENIYKSTRTTLVLLVSESF